MQNKSNVPYSLHERLVLDLCDKNGSINAIPLLRIFLIKDNDKIFLYVGLLSFISFYYSQTFTLYV